MAMVEVMAVVSHAGPPLGGQMPWATESARALERVRSDPMLATRELLNNMLTAATTGTYYSTDPSDSKTVELWAR
jgi:hypothetical protein